MTGASIHFFNVLELPAAGSLGEAGLGALAVCSFDADGVEGLTLPPSAVAGVLGFGEDCFAAKARGFAVGVFGFEFSGVLDLICFSGVLGLICFSGVLGLAAGAREEAMEERAPPVGGLPLPFAPAASAAFAFASDAARSAASVCRRNCSAAITASSAATAAAFAAAMQARSSSNAPCTARTRGGISKSASRGHCTGFIESFASFPLPSVPAKLALRVIECKYFA